MISHTKSFNIPVSGLSSLVGWTYFTCSYFNRDQICLKTTKLPDFQYICKISLGMHIVQNYTIWYISWYSFTILIVNAIYHDTTAHKLIELPKVQQNIISFLGIKCIQNVDFFPFGIDLIAQKIHYWVKIVVCLLISS